MKLLALVGTCVLLMASCGDNDATSTDTTVDTGNRIKSTSTTTTTTSTTTTSTTTVDNRWDDQVRANFMTECEVNAPQDICETMLTCMEGRMTQSELMREERLMARGEPTDRLLDDLAECTAVGVDGDRWDDEVRANFMTECEVNAPQDACEAALVCMEGEMAQSELTREERMLQRGEPSERLTSALEKCTALGA